MFRAEIGSIAAVPSLTGIFPSSLFTLAAIFIWLTATHNNITAFKVPTGVWLAFYQAFKSTIYIGAAGLFLPATLFTLSWTIDPAVTAVGMLATARVNIVASPGLASTLIFFEGPTGIGGIATTTVNELLFSAGVGNRYFPTCCACVRAVTDVGVRNLAFAKPRVTASPLIALSTTLHGTVASVVVFAALDLESLTGLGDAFTVTICIVVGLTRIVGPDIALFGIGCAIDLRGIGDACYKEQGGGDGE